MTTFLFLFRELLGTVRARSAGYLLLTCLLVFVFLGSFASLFLFVSPNGDRAEPGDPSEVRVWLSPRLTTSAIDALYYTLQDRTDVESLRFQFAQETEQVGTGGLFVVSLRGTSDPDVFAAEVKTRDGITKVEVRPAETEPQPLSLASSIRIALLLGLVLSSSLSLMAGRLGFRHLLEDFSGEIRLLRLSGIPQRAIAPPIVALGLMLGILSGLLIATGIALLHFMLAAETAFAADGLSDTGRVVGILVIDFLLGAIMGGLIGLLGASLLGRREFSPLP